MKDLSTKIQEALGKQLENEGYDVVDLVPIPARGDRMVRIRTLEEALDDFDSQVTGETIGYLVQVRQRPEASAGTGANAAGPAGDDNLFSQLVNETYAHHGRHSKDEPAVFERARPQAQQQQQPAEPLPQAHAKRPNLDGIYLPNGKLNARFLERNAELLFESGDYPLARNIYKTLLQSGERTHHALYRIGRCLEAEGNAVEAIANYEESITYHPTLDTYQRWAALLIRLKKDHQAAEVMERTLGIRDLPKTTVFELHKACGNCWMRAGKADLAEKQYRKALDVDPMADGIRANLGALCLEQGQLAEAKRHFQDAVAANPRNDKALAGLASCLFSEGDKRQAHDLFARSLDLQLGNPTAIFYLVKCAYEIKSYATAARIVGDYVQAAPVNTNLMYSLAGLQFHLGRVAEASSTARKILELQPQHAGAAELIKMIERYAGPR